jgi:hypothetical protein
MASIESRMNDRGKSISHLADPESINVGLPEHIADGVAAIYGKQKQRR